MCDYSHNSISKYNQDFKLVKEKSFTNPHGIEIDMSTMLLYIVDKISCTILDLNFELQGSWKLPTEPKNSGFRGVKVTPDRIYLTIEGIHQIFSCNKENGKIYKSYGNSYSGSGSGEFNTPQGITVRNDFLYICDSNNHRVQLFHKDKGSYITTWDKNPENKGMENYFTYPQYISYELSENLFYIGDVYSIQLWDNTGKRIQRIGDKYIGNKMTQFHGVYASCIMNNKLYVGDGGNKRIQIFDRASV